MSAPPTNPMIHSERASLYLHEINHTEDTPRLHWWGESFWCWEGSGPWRPLSEKDMERRALRWLIRGGKSSTPDAARAMTLALAALTTMEMPTDRHPPFWWPHSLRETDRILTENYLVNPMGATGPTEDDEPPAGCEAITSAWFTQNKVPIVYDPRATCPQWEAFLQGSLGEEDKISALQEYMGVLWTPDTRFEMALFLVGPAASGKSTIGKVIERLHGEANVGSLPLEEFGDPFAIGELRGKLVNICDETSRNITPRLESKLKWWTGGGKVDANRKHKSYVKMPPTARLVVPTNHFPNFTDSSEGTWRRILPLRMHNVVPREQRDRLLVDKLAGEASGIFNWTLEGLRRLRRRGHFVVPKSGEVELASRKTDKQGPTLFVAEEVEGDSDGFVANDVLLKEYKRWAKRSCLPVGDDDTTLRELILQSHGGATYGRKRCDGERPHGIKGVRLRASKGD